MSTIIIFFLQQKDAPFSTKTEWRINRKKIVNNVVYR